MISKLLLFLLIPTIIIDYHCFLLKPAFGKSEDGD